MKNNNIARYHKVLMVGTPIISVPENMFHVTNKGNETVIKTLTKTGRLTTRNKRPVIKLDTNNQNKIIIRNGGYSRSSIKQTLLEEGIIKKNGLKSVEEELKKKK